MSQRYLVLTVIYRTIRNRKFDVTSRITNFTNRSKIYTKARYVVNIDKVTNCVSTESIPTNGIESQLAATNDFEELRSTK